MPSIRGRRLWQPSGQGVAGAREGQTSGQGPVKVTGPFSLTPDYKLDLHMSTIVLRRNLQAALRWCQANEDHDETICLESASLIRDARKRAIAAGLPDIATMLSCSSDMVAPIAAQRYLSAALAALPTDGLMSVPDVARRLKVSPAKVRSWISSGQLKAMNTGGKRKRHRVSPDALEAFARGHAAPAPPVKARKVKRLVQRY